MLIGIDVTAETSSTIRGDRVSVGEHLCFELLVFTVKKVEMDLELHAGVEHELSRHQDHLGLSVFTWKSSIGRSPANYVTYRLPVTVLPLSTFNQPTYEMVRISVDNTKLCQLPGLLECLMA